MILKPANRKLSRSLSRFVVGALAFLMMTGGQWFVLQSIAWARMIVVYAQQDSLYTALKKTFDGRHPCALCLQIRHGQQEEQQKGSQFPREKPEKMPELFCDARCIAVPLAPEANVDLPAFPLGRYSDFVESPPTPPPRVGVAVL
jgi:hypothetical protein